MAYNHPSGLPDAFDRAQGRDDWRGVVFYGSDTYLQGAELNEAQTIMRDRLRRFGRLVVSDGDRIEGGQVIINRDAGTVQMTAGRVFADGDVWRVPEALLTGVPMAGRVEIGIRVQTDFITHEDDPDLLGLVPGSDAEGEPGAGREVGSAIWAHVNDGNSGAFYAVYQLLNGVVLDTDGPNILAPVLQAIQDYDRPNGNYVVSGCQVTALGANAGAQMFSISEGEANINGMKRTRLAALRHLEPEDWDEAAIPGETHIYPASAVGGSHTITVSSGPIGVVNSVLITKERTVTVTRGALANGADGLPDSSVISISRVWQGGTDYTSPASYIRTGNSVDWQPAGAEPAIGSTYNVTYRYRASVTPSAVGPYQVTVSGGAADGDVIIAYTRKLPRVDRLCLNESGAPVYLTGLSAWANPLPPAVPANVLRLATITKDWVSTPTVVNDADIFPPVSELRRYMNAVVDMQRLVQLERLKSGINALEPVAKKGMFVDPLIDDTYRDAGSPQSGAILDGMLMLSVTPTFFRASLTAPVLLHAVDDVIIDQPLKTGCELINPYQNFTPLPGTLSLSPAVDFWTESRTEWLSAQTAEFNRGTRFDGGPLQTASTVTRLEDRRSEQLEFLRQISVSYTLRGFGSGELLQTLTFDGVSVLTGTPAADAGGQITGTFSIPEGVTAGTKTVFARGAGGTEARALFSGQGSVTVDVMRQVTTVETWSAGVIDPAEWGGGITTGDGNSGEPADPQAQLFAVPELRQVSGVRINVCRVGDPANRLIVNQVSVSNGYPTTDIRSEAVVDMTAVVPGPVTARYRLPVTTSPQSTHAFVVKTDDGEHSISIAGLGDFDADAQRWVTSHPYVTGPRFSSVNASTWTAHQDEALTFAVIANRYPVTTRTVALGSYNLVQASDLQVRAAVELPSAACSVVFEIERTNGTVYRLAPFQVLQLTEYLTEQVTLRAVLSGTEKLSPVLFAPVDLIAGQVAQQLTYITRSFTLGEAVRVAAYFKAYLPGGATTSMSISVDGGAWQALPLAAVEQLAYPLWTERKYQLTGLTGTTARLRITGTGGPSARLIIGDLGAGIM